MSTELNESYGDPSTKVGNISLGEIALGVLLLIAAILFFNSARIEDKSKDKDKAAAEMFEKEKKKDKSEEGFGRVHIDDCFFAGVWACSLGIGLISLGGWSYTRKPNGPEEAQSAVRANIIVAGGLVGILTFFLGLLLLYEWSDSLIEWLERGKSKEAKWPFYALLTVFGGLVVMFAALQSARPEIRNNSGIRRLYFGFNAAMTTLFLVVLLIGFNIYTSLKWTGVIDTTERGFYTLDAKSKELLHNLNEPVKAYLIDPPVDELYPEITSLLQNCERESPNFKSIILNPSFDSKEINRLATKFKLSDDARDQFGILLVIGENESQSSFLKMRDLIQQNFQGPRGSESISFAGEGRIMTELSFLGEGKVQPIVYVLQGSGELDISPPPQGRPDPAKMAPPERSASLLVKYLGERKFDVRPLSLELNIKEEFDSNAAAIVAFVPPQGYDERVSNILTDYMRPKDPKRKPGRLVAVLPPSRSPIRPSVGPTGLETLLSEFGIEVTPAKIVQYLPQFGGPSEMPAAFEARDVAGTPLGRLISDPMQFPPSRPLRALPALRPELQVKTVLETLRAPSWLEKSFSVDNDQILRAMAAERPNDRGEMVLRQEKNFSGERPRGILITAALAPPSPDPQAPPGEPKPRIVVFGWDGFNDRLAQRNRGSETYFEIFADMLDWLREKPTNIGITPRERKILTIPPDATAARLFVMPLALCSSIVILLGVAVWVVRRR